MKTAQQIEERKAAKIGEQGSAENSGRNSRTGTKGNSARIARFRFQKGRSGNPGGRPKSDFSRQIAKAIFEQNPQAVYRAMCRSVLSGSAYAFQVCSDRAYGKVRDVVELTRQDSALAEMTSEALDARIDELMGKLKLRPTKRQKQQKPEKQK
jgi:hypothetical protein